MISDRLSQIHHLLRGKVNALPFTRDTANQISNSQLGGYIYAQTKDLIPEEYRHQFYCDFLNQSLKNEILLDELESIEAGANDMHPDLKIVRLKGSSYIEDFFLKGERFLTDIDLLINPLHLHNLDRVLKKNSYHMVPQIIWHANDYRYTYQKTLPNGFHIFIDVHTRLFWSQNKQYSPALRKINNFYSLQIEDQLLHMIANWAHQDTFVGINKMIDIYVFIEKYFSQINKSNFIKIISDNGLYRSLLLVAAALDNSLIYSKPLAANTSSHSSNKLKLIIESTLTCHSSFYTFKKHFNTVRFYILKLIITKDFLLQPTSRKIRYHFLKYYSKKNMPQAFYYYTTWIWANLFRKKFRTSF